MNSWWIADSFFLEIFIDMVLRLLSINVAIWYMDYRTHYLSNARIDESHKTSGQMTKMAPNFPARALQATLQVGLHPLSRENLNHLSDYNNGIA